jgi:hypothetical protein
MIVTIETKPAIARDLNKGRPTLAEAQHLRSIVSALGLQLRPLHPGTTDPELASRFYVTTPDQQAAEEARRRIEESGVVEAVYVKPPDAMPFQ